MRGLSLLLGGWALVNGVMSVSGGAIVSGLIVGAIVLLKSVIGWLTGRRRLSPAVMVAIFAAAPIAVLAVPSIYGFVSLVLGGKADSTSFENRSTADAMSYTLSGETLGIGVGVGSNRPSSFAASLLSTTGYLGVLLFACAAIVIVARAVRVPRFQPAAWAFISIIISKIVSGPDTSEPPMWFLLAVCAAASWSSVGSGDTSVSDRPDRAFNVVPDEPVGTMVPAR